jgi:intermediate filament protein if
VAKIKPYQNGDAKTNSNDLNKSQTDMSATTTYQRNARGPISIYDIEKDGQFIVLENTSRTKDITLTGWSIKREIDFVRTLVFKFPNGFVVRKSSKLKVWSGCEAGRDEPANGEIQNKEVATWGVARSQAVTTVLNEDGAEKATHIQKTLYSNINN